MNPETQQSELSPQLQQQEIIVFPNLAWARFRVIGLAVCWLVALAGSLVLLKFLLFSRDFLTNSIGITVAIMIFIVVAVCLIVLSVNADSDLFDPGEHPILLIIMVAVTLLAGGAIIGKAIRQFRENKPMLQVNCKRVLISGLREEDNISLLWNKIEAIYTYDVGSHARLCIRPKQGKWWSKPVDVRTGAPFNIPQRHLDQPISNIIEQIQTGYASELQLYDVKISSHCLEWPEFSS